MQWFKLASLLYRYRRDTFLGENPIQKVGFSGTAIAIFNGRVVIVAPTDPRRNICNSWRLRHDCGFYSEGKIADFEIADFGR